VDVGIFFFESRHELRKDFALASHRPDAKRGLVAGGGRRAPKDSQAQQQPEGDAKGDSACDVLPVSPSIVNPNFRGHHATVT
jgi:hypothetical protein